MLKIIFLIDSDVVLPIVLKNAFGELRSNLFCTSNNETHCLYCAEGMAGMKAQIDIEELCLVDEVGFLVCSARVGKQKIWIGFLPHRFKQTTEEDRCQAQPTIFKNALPLEIHEGQKGIR